MALRLIFITDLFLNLLFIQPPVQRAPRFENGADVINAVNSLRSTYGLAPYELDEQLMSTAQSHSEYQASINTLTHTRADGSGAEIVSSENIALGYGQPIDSVIQQQWADDYWHTVTLIGFYTGRAGAGVATGSDGRVYYTLDVINTGGQLTNLSINSLPASTSAPGAVPGTAATPSTVQPLISAMTTATLLPDGSLYHVVQSGQNLTNIAKAYGISLKELTDLNKIDASRVITIGQQLLIHPAYTLTPMPSPTETKIPPTATVQATSTPFATRLPGITPTPAPAGFAPSIEKLPLLQKIGGILIVVSISGLTLAFMGRKMKKK